MDIKINQKSTRSSRNLWWIQVLSVLPSTVQKIRRTNWFARAWRRVSFLICNINKWQMINMINDQDKRWVCKMNFPVPRLTTSPATMIISICSSEMKRPPTQNWLKNCDFRKIFKIASKTVTFERPLKLAQTLWLLNIPKWTWVMMKDCSKSFVLFPGRGLCLVLYAQLKYYVWSKLLWLLHACFDLIIWDFAIGVSNVT